MPAPPTAILFTFRQLPTVTRMLEARGLALSELLARAGLPPDATAEVTAPLARIQAFVDETAARLEAPLFGVDLAEQIPRGAFGMTEFVVRAAPTVQDGLGALCELSPLINPLLDMRYVADARGCEVRFTFSALRDALGAHLNEYTVAFIAKSFASVLGRPLPLERAWFAHARHLHIDELARRLDCPVAFQQADTGFALTSDVVLHRPAAADPPLFAFLLQQARTQLANSGTHDLVAHVMRTIERRLANPGLTTAEVAEAMSTTARSLQRHLADAGTSFREVLARVRQRRRAELERGGLSESEVAGRLGFANVRTMRRSLDEGGEPGDGAD